MNKEKLVKKLYKKSFKDPKFNLKKLKELKVIKENNLYYKKGVELVKNGFYGVVILAGGNGSRLGFNGPKGCMELNIFGKFISFFEIYISQLKKYNIPVYIMTSTLNNEVITKYFEEKNYFNYKKENIKFFVQTNLPILDIKGNVLNQIGPSGNGDVFASLKRNNLIKDIKKRNLKYLLFVNIDNILNNLVDFNFIGTTISNNYNLASKTKKTGVKEWVFCKYKKHPIMLPDINLTSELKKKYFYKNISYHLISTDLIEKFSNKKLPFHRAFKKTIYEGKKIDSFKFEKFIFDAFKYSKDMLLYETNEPFYPIKRVEDINKAITLYERNNHIK